MDDDLKWIDLHFFEEPEEAAALKSLIAAFPACREDVRRLLEEMPSEKPADPFKH